MIQSTVDTKPIVDVPQSAICADAAIRTGCDTEELIPEESVRDLSYVSLSNHGYCVVKRILDTVFSVAGLFLLLIPFMVIAAAIYADDPGEIFFSQYRVGRNGKLFKLYKFRTMRMDAPKYLPTMQLKDPEQYITRIGGFLRRTSLDELPQLINVARGDMSLVGPRPLIAEECEIHQMRTRFGVYNIRPGITGLAQINGRDTVTAANKVRMDVVYLEHFGFLMDLRILLSTLPRLTGDESVVEGCDANHTDRSSEH